jgi:hypothetical protein
LGLSRFSKIPSQNYINSGTNFSSFRDLQLILSITVQSIFAVEQSSWARWKDISKDNFTKIKNKIKQQQQFFYVGSLKMELLKKVFLIFFKYDKLAEDYHLLLSSKPLEGDIFCLENIDFILIILIKLLSNISLRNVLFPDYEIPIKLKKSQRIV